MASRLDFLPTRLNTAPVVFRGMTGHEVGMMVLSGLAAGLLPGAISAWLLGAIAMVPTVAFASAGVALYFGGAVMRRLRRGRPASWIYRSLQFRMARQGIRLWGGETLITRSGPYSRRRLHHQPGGRP
ncbi:TIGR03750 family conjugal transfer protein [Halomonas sp. KAO]|uniref:TIGR03750 family conjugal transfer protein n=1 Tax=Halomonas sp. KAO TaxID=2783858 RepID=UPI00189CCBC6|nr:TIGR03750 family conjugal transfer protein [Halomonas sp. KAO]MBF7052271.1 TIGR03750 family conjugal transfer protein [Halomonas sp. KAO]